jgi:hypothetical protein
VSQRDRGHAYLINALYDVTAVEPAFLADAGSARAE